jgi:hypothetical protein
MPACGALVIAVRATSVARPDRTDLWCQTIAESRPER